MIFDLTAFLPRAVMQGIPLLYGSTGEILTEKSGNLNLGIPGVMYVGGICGVIGAFFYEQSTPAADMNAFLAIGIPMLCSLLGSLLMGLLYCLLTVTLRANQNVTGLALTTFGVGIGNFFGGGLSLGIDCAMNLDCANYDNGTYVIENWEIVGRLHLEHSECYADYSVNDMLKEIDKRMPESERLGEGFFDAEEVAAEELQVGDTVFVFDTDSHCYSPRVVNITPDKVYFDGAMSGSIDLKRGLMPQMVRRLPKS